MNNKTELTFQQTVQFARMQAWTMSFFCGLLCLFATAAATRVPHYLLMNDYARLTGVTLFGLLALAGLADNIRTHACLWRRRNEYG